MELKDKLNLLLKFLFLAVFTYGVISVTCCKKSCSTSCSKQSGQVTSCGKQNVKQPCDSGWDKPCCKKSCSTSCSKQSEQIASCEKKKAKQSCGTDCVKPCCANK